MRKPNKAHCLYWIFTEINERAFYARHYTTRAHVDTGRNVWRGSRSHAPIFSAQMCAPELINGQQ